MAADMAAAATIMTLEVKGLCGMTPLDGIPYS
jgi:hypothetical protein